MNEISALLIGFLLGLKHATEADHLVAVATLATRQHSLAQSMRQGVAWGIGHTVTLLLFGGVALALGTSIPPHLAGVLELAVGAMLILLGADVLRRFVRRRIHFHVHTHESGVRHLHAHGHADTGVIHGAHDHPHAAGPPLRALAVGMTHGMAGSAALIVLSVGAAQSLLTGLAFIVLFGIGSIAGMAVLSVAIAIPLRLSATRLNGLFNGLSAVIGGSSCALGLAMVYQHGLARALGLD